MASAIVLTSYALLNVVKTFIHVLSQRIAKAHQSHTLGHIQKGHIVLVMEIVRQIVVTAQHANQNPLALLLELLLVDASAWDF